MECVIISIRVWVGSRVTPHFPLKLTRPPTIFRSLYFSYVRLSPPRPLHFLPAHIYMLLLDLAAFLDFLHDRG